jgi:hypothetical protein
MAILKRIKNMRTYTLTRDQVANFNSELFVMNLKSVGFVFESEVGPIKLKQPWEAVRGPNGSTVYRQWDVESLMERLGPFMVEIEDTLTEMEKDRQAIAQGKKIEWP